MRDPIQDSPSWFRSFVEELNVLRRELRTLQDLLTERQAAERQRYVSTAEAAIRLGKVPKTIRNWCRSGRLVGYKADGGEWIVDVESIERLRPRSDP